MPKKVTLLYEDTLKDFQGQMTNMKNCKLTLKIVHFAPVGKVCSSGLVLTECH